MSFENISLIPQKCIVNSRKECNTSTIIGNRSFKLPIIPANMKSIIDINICKLLALNNYFYIMHRFNIDLLDFAHLMEQLHLFLSISVGINDDSYNELNKLLLNNIYPEYITVDVANVWSNKGLKMVDYIKSHFPKSFLIAGNVATSDACIELQDHGVNCIKIGVGNGHVCTTFHKTGFGSRLDQYKVIEKCSSAVKVPIMADGGFKYHGDIAKAINLGAQYCMSAYLFSGCIETPGHVEDIDGKKYKMYYGSASMHNKKEKKNIEGTAKFVPFNNTSVLGVLTEIEEDLQSAISYAGGIDLYDIRKTRYLYHGCSK